MFAIFTLENGINMLLQLVRYNLRYFFHFDTHRRRNGIGRGTVLAEYAKLVKGRQNGGVPPPFPKSDTRLLQ